MKTPHQISDERMGLSEEYSRYSGELASLIKKSAEHFNTYRKDFKSDKATEKAFEVTEDGVRMTIIKLKLKALEKQMSAYKTQIDVLTNEAHGMY